MKIGNDEILFEPCNSSSSYMYVPTRGLIALIDKEKEERISNRELDITEQIREYPYIDLDEVYSKEINTIPYLAIDISDGCQLRCEYCYLSAEKLPTKMLMTFEEARKIVDAYIYFLKFEHQDKLAMGQVVWISFYGGAEPTFNWITLKETVEYIGVLRERENIDIRLRITTNGYYGKECAKFIVDRFDNILLSFDGCEIAHNLHRKTSEGYDSFNKVYDTAKVFYNGNKRFAVRITVSNYTYPYIEESLKFISKEFPGVNVLIGKVANIGRANEKGLEKIEDYSNNLINIIEKYKDKLSFSLLEKKQIKDVHICYCGAVRGKSFIISRDMTIKCCAHADNECLFEIGGIVDNKIVINKEKLSHLQKMFDIRERTDCKECIAKYHCAGGCPSNRVYSVSDWQESCEVSKKLFLNNIKSFLERRI